MFMKKITIVLFIFILCGLQANALKWHDNLINYMLKQPIKDKQIVVERDETTMQIKRASYRFSFVRHDVAAKIRRLLYSHESEAQKFSNEGNELIMQVKEAPNTYYTYSFGHDPNFEGRYLLLISVRQGKFPNPGEFSYIYPYEDYGVEMTVYNLNQ